MRDAVCGMRYACCVTAQLLRVPEKTFQPIPAQRPDSPVLLKKTCRLGQAEFADFQQAAHDFVPVRAASQVNVLRVFI